MTPCLTTYIIFGYSRAWSCFAEPDIYYPFDELVEGEILGFTNGIIEGDAPLVEGKVGNAVYTNGFNQSVNLGNVRHTCLGNITKCKNGLSVSLWVKPYGTGVVFLMTNGGHTHRSIGINLMQKAPGLLITIRNETGYWQAENVPFEPGHWYHIMMVWVPNTVARLYLNGCLARETYVFAKKASNKNRVENDLMLGASNIPGDINKYRAEMTMDDLKMWDAVMDDNKVWEIFMSYFDADSHTQSHFWFTTSCRNLCDFWLTLILLVMKHYRWLLCFISCIGITFRNVCWLKHSTHPSCTPFPVTCWFPGLSTDWSGQNEGWVSYGSVLIFCEIMWWSKLACGDLWNWIFPIDFQIGRSVDFQKTY